MLRNAPGVEEDNSGVPIDREADRRSVEFRRTHASWRGCSPDNPVVLVLCGK
jgi:hypothetical protein